MAKCPAPRDSGMRFTNAIAHPIMGDRERRASGAAKEGWLSPVEGTRLEIERGVKLTVGSNPTPSAVPPGTPLVF